MISFVMQQFAALWQTRLPAWVKALLVILVVSVFATVMALLMHNPNGGMPHDPVDPRGL